MLENDKLEKEHDRTQIEVLFIWNLAPRYDVRPVRYSNILKLQYYYLIKEDRNLKFVIKRVLFVLKRA